MARTPVPMSRRRDLTPLSMAVEITEEIIAKIATNIRAGMLQIHAAGLEGVPQPTFGAWLRKRGPLYDLLRLEISKAEAHVQARLSLVTMAGAAPPTKPGESQKGQPNLALQLMRYRNRMAVHSTTSFRKTSLRKGGRPTEWTQKKQNEIAKLVADGNYFETACRRAGVAPDTAREWLSLGKIETGKPEDQWDWDYVPLLFYLAIMAARDEYETSAVSRISAAGREGDWKADAWMLTHGPTKRRWTQQIEQTVNTNVTGTVQHAHTLQQQIAERASDFPVDVLQQEHARLGSLLDLIEGPDGSFEVKE